MRSICFLLASVGFVMSSLQGLSTPIDDKRSFYEIRIYTFAGKQQEEKIERFLSNAYLPALHRAGIPKVGVFKPIEKDTVAYGKKIFVFIPYTGLDQFVSLTKTLADDKQFQEAGSDYLKSPFDAAPYKRFESILLNAFADSPVFEVPALTAAKPDRIYELRSYESATEKLYVNKVQMFNLGDEIGLFKRLGFNAVFYAEVLAGSHMPNLMYMTSFNSMTSRDEHWKAFVDDPQWKKLVAMPEYQHNVSKSDIFLLHAATYSDL